MPEREFLRHHVAEADAQDMRIGPADFVHQPGGIVGIIGHGEGLIAFPALAQAALVVSQKVEMPDQRTGKPGFRPRRSPDQEQELANALSLIKKGWSPRLADGTLAP